VSQYTKLGKNIALITLGNFASKLLSFFFIPLYTAVLTTAEYGTADLMTTTINLFSPIFTLLISEAVMRFALEQQKSKEQVFTIGVSVTLGGFAVMVICSPLILFSKALRPFWGYFILYYFFATAHTLAGQFVKGIEKVSVYSLAGVLQTLCFIAANVFLLFVCKIGAAGYLLALIISNAFAAQILWSGAHLSQYLISPKRIDWTLLKEMLRYSVPMIPNSLSWWISNSSDKYLLTHFSGVAITGVYSVSQRIPSLFSTLSTIFMSAWQISAAEDFGSEGSRRFYTKVYNQYSAFNILLVSALICGCKLLAGILFSKDFFAGWRYVPILLFAYLFYAMASFWGSIYTSAKKTKMLFLSTTTAAVSNIVLNAILIPGLGAQGAAIATFASYFIVWLMRMIDTRKILLLQIRLKADIISYLILTAQIIIMLSDMPYSFLSSLGLFILLCALNYKFLWGIIQSGRKLLTRNYK